MAQMALDDVVDTGLKTGFYGINILKIAGVWTL